MAFPLADLEEVLTMAGRGPQPKDPSARARRNSDPAALRVVESDPVEQPPLPDRPEGKPWPLVTLDWWLMWGTDPLSAEFRATDWAELQAAALIHAAFWEGDFKLGGELRLRVAKFGATQEDRARLRISFAQADQADEKASRTRTHDPARRRRPPLTAV